MARPFRVVTYKNWLVDDLRDAADSHPGISSIIQDWGFDIDPRTSGETLWWAGGHWVASARAAGVRLPLLSCGPDWLKHLPWEYRRRRVDVVELCHVTSLVWQWQKMHTWDGTLFLKLPEAKVDDIFPAHAFHEPLDRLADHLARTGLPSNTLIQVSEEIKFWAEARFFVSHKEIVAGGLYRLHDSIWGSPEFDESCPDAVDPMLKMFHKARELVRWWPSAPGFTLDMGMTADGYPVVVEANASWSSGIYNCDPAGILESIISAHDFSRKYPEWSWNHNPVFDYVQPLKIINLP